MSAYTLLRLAHSYWRWAVLATAIVVVARGVRGWRAGEWSAADERAFRSFASAFDLQVLIGLVLYFGFSPFWPATYQTFSETMRGDVARFFGVEHETAMFIANVVVNVARVRLRKAEAKRRHRLVLTTMGVFFLLVLWAIPWPWRIVGRPLFRTTL